MGIQSIDVQYMIKLYLIIRYFRSTNILKVSYENFLKSTTGKPVISLKEFAAVYEEYYHINYATRNELTAYVLFKDKKIIALNPSDKSQLEGIVDNGEIVPITPTEMLELCWLSKTKLGNPQDMLKEMRNNSYNHKFMEALLEENM